MKRRIFIAINLPEDIKGELGVHQDKIELLFEPPSPIRWTKKENLHITWEFLGDLSEDELMKACQDTEDLASKHKPFTIALNKICYGPPKKMPPRMIWVTAAFEKASLAQNGRGEKNKEFSFTPHITLGRIKMWEFRQIEPEARPQVDENINLTFEVDSIEVMESVLKRGGPTYTILESCPLTPLEIPN